MSEKLLPLLEPGHTFPIEITINGKTIQFRGRVIQIVQEATHAGARVRANVALALTPDGVHGMIYLNYIEGTQGDPF